tara:strand:+ start:108 stop:314 length:207 start_codon:yes stop_codon:yes gene_type:complete
MSLSQHIVGKAATWYFVTPAAIASSDGLIVTLNDFSSATRTSTDLGGGIGRHAAIPDAYVPAGHVVEV